MEIFLEFLKEALKGMTRAISAHVIQKTFLDEKKPPSRRKLKGGFRNKK